MIFDSGLKGDDYVSFVATDNRKGGRLGGEHLAKVLGGKGKVVLLRYAEGHGSTEQREEGFLEAMKREPRASRWSARTSTAAPTWRSAYKRSETLLSRYKQPDGSLGIDGIFCPTSPPRSACCARCRPTAGRARCASSASTPPTTWWRRCARARSRPGGAGPGAAWATWASRRWSATCSGEPVERRIDTGVDVVTRANMDEPEMKELLQPGPVAMAEAVTAAARASRCAASARRSARRSRWPASTWRCAPGEVCALVGENGAGKSTLMKVLSGALAARRGRRWRSTARPTAARVRWRRAAPASR